MKHTLICLWILMLTGNILVAEEILAIKADRVDTVSSGIIHNGIVLIRDGRITAVGAEVEIPANAQILDVNDKTVFPGLINPYSQAGISYARGGGTTPHYRTVDELYPPQPIYDRCLQAGFTTMALCPSGGNIAGQGVIIRPHGDQPDDMIVVKSGVLIADVSSSLQSSLKSGQKSPNSDDPKIEPLARVVKGELPLFVHCDRPGQTVHLLKYIEDYKKLKVTLICGPENIQLAQDLAQKKIPVLVPAKLHMEPYTTNRYHAVRQFAEAGVTVACHPVSDSIRGHEDFLRQMADLVRTGLDTDTAKKAITLHPAQMLGLEYRLGSIEIGKDANLLILSGDPLAVDTKIHRIIIEGKTVYKNSTH